MNSKIGLFAGGTIIVLLAGCMGSSPVKQADPYPDWYYNSADAIPGALNSASCVPIPGTNMDIARKQALANGKAEIAGQIETRIKAMDKTYDRIANTDQGSSSGGTFESVSKQVVNQTLSGIRAVKSTRVEDKEKSFFCSLVSLNPDMTKQLVSKIIQSANLGLSATDEHVLREQFNAYKAQQELEKQF